MGKALRDFLAPHQVTLIDFQQYDIPLVVNGHIDRDALTPFQQQLADAMEKAHLIYIITPEYNWSTTPEILNWLHRFGDRGFMPLFDNKVFALIGVSTGKGGKAPVLHLTGILNKIISFMDLQSVVSPKLFESHYTKDVLDEYGHLIQANPEYEKGLKNFTDYTLKLAARWHK